MPQADSSFSGKAVIIIPCHNRKFFTTGCLRQLKELGILRTLGVIVVDDGSTDGTAEAVAADFPEATVLHGDGNLFWTGAMELGMRHAIAHGAACCVWLNDDLSLGENAIERVVALALESKSMVTGQGVIDQGDKGWWYFPGLFRRKSSIETRTLAHDSPAPIPMDTCRGNLVAVPRNVVEKIGYPDGKNVPHVGGDTDFGLRATAAGIRCLVRLDAMFFEKDTIRDDNRSWLLGKRPIKKIWQSALSKRGTLYPRMVVVYNLRHWGIRGVGNVLFVYARLVVLSILKALIPRPWLIRLYGNKSHAYVVYKGSPAESDR